jgi:hypothetical protein
LSWKVDDGKPLIHGVGSEEARVHPCSMSTQSTDGEETIFGNTMGKQSADEEVHEPGGIAMSKQSGEEEEEGEDGPHQAVVRRAMRSLNIFHHVRLGLADITRHIIRRILYLRFCVQTKSGMTTT